MFKHILSASQFDREETNRIFQVALGMEDKVANNNHHQLLTNRKGVNLLFFEESFRTYGRFQNAVISMGGRVLISISKPKVFSSGVDDAINDLMIVSEKGEPLLNVIENFCYDTVGAMVIRHPARGSAQRAAEIVNPYGISIINAGDGSNEHPTQALLDGYTIWKRNDHKLSDARIVFCNDLEQSRTIHSGLILGYNNGIREFGLCAPEGVNLPEEYQAELENNGVRFIRFANLYEAAEWGQFIYMTRPQKERYPNPEDMIKFLDFQVNKETMDHIANHGGFVLHPQPIDRLKFNEITQKAQENPSCIIMEQAHNGLPVTQALLRMTLVPLSE